MKSFVPRIFAALVMLAIVSVVVLAMMPNPVAVDLVTISRGPLVVTITDDGRTRIRERYVVSAPLNGRLVRIQLKPGDKVVANDTLLTTIEPTEAALLDPRAIAQAEARVKAADARLQQAQPRLESARVAMNLAETELGRLQKLADKKSGSPQELDAQRAAFRQAENDYAAAHFEMEIAGFELEVARAALIRGRDDEEPSGWSFPVKSPISGSVLRVFQESSTVLMAGERIMEVGDPTDLEVEVDVLSTAAVRIRPGNRVMLEQWGGNNPLDARVRLIEPSAFTKVSALGIEEQRVNVIIDFVDAAETRPPLADGYRVEAAIVEWEATDVLKVASGALFRIHDNWAVFVVVEDHAQIRHVELGHRNDNEAEVLSGLQQGDRVILYPGDRVEEGIAIEERSS